jgi:hypothetical protein
LTDQLEKQQDIPRRRRRVYVPMEQFERGLEATQELLEAETLRLLVGSDLRRFQFELREPDAAETLTRHSLTLAEMKALFVDLEDILIAASKDIAVERFARSRADASRFPDGEVEDPQNATKKYLSAQKVFSFSAIRSRVWLKSSAKIDLASRFDWEVGRKYADAERPRPDSGPVVFGTLRVAAEPGGLRLPFTAPKELSLLLDAEDVAYMIDTLRRLQAAMAAADTDESDE